MELIMLDTNIYGRPFDDLKEKGVRNEALACYEIFLMAFSKFIEIKTSDVLFAELNMIKNRSKRDIMIYLANTLGKERIILNNSIIKIADSLLPYSKDYMDSFHIAFAAEGKCSYFVTCDKELTHASIWIEKLLRKLNYNIKIRNPLVFLHYVK